MRCTEWWPEVRAAELHAAQVIFGTGRVGPMWGWAGPTPGWATHRRWKLDDARDEAQQGPARADSAEAARDGSLVARLVDMRFGLPATGWGRPGKGPHAADRRVLFGSTSHHEGLMRATIMHMHLPTARRILWESPCAPKELRSSAGSEFWAALKALVPVELDAFAPCTANFAANVGEQMARAACLVPSLWQAPKEPCEQKGLETLCEWARLERRRPYPIEVVGRESGKGSVEEQAEWQRRRLRVRVVPATKHGCMALHCR